MRVLLRSEFKISGFLKCLFSSTADLKFNCMIKKKCDLPNTGVCKSPKISLWPGRRQFSYAFHGNSTVDGWPLTVRSGLVISPFQFPAFTHLYLLRFLTWCVKIHVFDGELSISPGNSVSFLPHCIFFPLLIFRSLHSVHPSSQLWDLLGGSSLWLWRSFSH